MLFFSPIFLSSNSFLFYLLCSIFCSRKSFLLTLFTLNLVVMSICPYKIRLPSLKIMLKSKLHSQGCNKIIFLASINCKDDTVATEVSCLSTQFFLGSILLLLCQHFALCFSFPIIPKILLAKSTHP